MSFAKVRSKCKAVRAEERWRRTFCSLRFQLSGCNKMARRRRNPLWLAQLYNWRYWRKSPKVTLARTAEFLLGEVHDGATQNCGERRMGEGERAAEQSFRPRDVREAQRLSGSLMRRDLPNSPRSACRERSTDNGSSIWPTDELGSASLTLLCPLREKCSCLSVNSEMWNKHKDSSFNFICPSYGRVTRNRHGLLSLCDL